MLTDSTVVCIYLKGSVTRADATPPLANAKASVSVPVALDAAPL